MDTDQFTAMRFSISDSIIVAVNVYEENVWYLNISKPGEIQFSVHLISFLFSFWLNTNVLQAYMNPTLKPNM